MVIQADNPLLQYCGRIDFSNPAAPVMVYPCSFVRFWFFGNHLTVTVENNGGGWKHYLGCIVDDVQEKYSLPKYGKQTYDISVNQEKKIHEVVIFKRQDGCHLLTFHQAEIKGGVLLTPPPLPERKIEVYGDSVSAGEVSEAVAYTGREDPPHEGEYSNSWYSYAWMTARKLNAQIHDIAQGGIALMDGSGWFMDPEYVGLETIYDKVRYVQRFGGRTSWDFSKYRPQVVIIAIGQNDSHPEDYMALEPYGEKASIWKEHYKKFVETIRGKYPKAQIILATTILEHSKEWDAAIGEITRELNDKSVHHFLYKKNGCGTKGHVRIPEAEEMAEELSTYIQSMGEEIWEREKKGEK